MTGRDEIQNYYRGRETAEKYIGERFVSELNRLLHDYQVSVVNRVKDTVRPSRLLEIAPGPGRITRDVRPTGTFVCLEYNDAMINVGRGACNGDVSWVRGDGFQLPFSQAFDLVYSFRFVRHFQDGERQKFYAEVRRVLQPGGYFVMDAVNERLSTPLRKATPQEYPVYDKLYRVDELREELRRAGLEPVELSPVQKYFRWQRRSQVLLGPRANWLNRIVIRLLERLPRNEGLEWVVTCRRA
jgi:SAM-dependent methyltransferase